MRLNILWLLMIVILPFPTEIVAGYDRTGSRAGLYAGKILALAAFVPGVHFYALLCYCSRRSC
jgi:uncharacterized membrane protein